MEEKYTSMQNPIAYNLLHIIFLENISLSDFVYVPSR